MTQNNEVTQHTFRGLGIAPGILDTLDRMKFKVPTPIQHQAIPIAIEGKDVMGIAQTGTGKTMAFGIPMVQRLAGTPGKGIVIVPTRELALQVDEAIRKISQAFNIRTVVLIGGMNMNTQIQVLRKEGVRILIATPGRLLDHIQQRTVNLSDAKIVVLDEADRMLDMGFAPQIQRIFPHIPKDRQTHLFSATMPSEIMHMATSYMKLPIRVEVARSGTAAENVTQELYIVRRESKRQLLSAILKQYHGSVLVFARTRFDALRLTKAIREMNHSVAEIHSDRSLGQRREALDGFKTGRYRVLVATDIASRGIDVKGIELVINYDLPDDTENYVHRIGRTGRAGHEGRAISLVTPDQRNQVRSIELFMRTQLKISTHPEFPAEGFDKPVVIARSFRGGRRGRSSGPKRYVR
jgi:ATP-dependent RNA helicase RhlE